MDTDVFAAIEKARRAITADIDRALLEAKAFNAYVNGLEEALRHLDVAEQVLRDGGTFGRGASEARPKRGRPRLLPDADAPPPTAKPEACRHRNVEPTGVRGGDGFEIWRCTDCGIELGASAAALRDAEKTAGRG